MRAVWLVALCTSLASADLGPAAGFLRHQLDYTHDAFWVYHGEAMPENHFPVLGLLSRDPPDDSGRLPIRVSTHCTDNPQSSPECIRSEVTRGDAGACLQHGYMPPGDVVPRANWGDQPDAATDLSQAHTLTFYARGERGGERAEFFMGGIGRGDPTIQRPDAVARYPDVPKVSTGEVHLDKTWRRFTLRLPDGIPRNHVISGFAWWQWAQQDAPSVIYLDSIWYDYPRAREPRLPPSLVIESGEQRVDQAQRGFAHIYDSALSMIAFLALGDMRHARLIAEAFCYVMSHDPDGDWTQRGLRNCYSAGDIALPPGWLSSGGAGAARLAGFWNRKDDAEHPDGVWYQDKYGNAVYVGNVAWAGIALCHSWRATGERRYLDVARDLGRWILTHARTEAGFRGGMDYWAKEARPILWTSTEHNLDCFVLFTLLAKAGPSGSTAWSEPAQHARDFAVSMWDKKARHFWTGLTDTGNINHAFVPVDVQAWAALALRDPSYYRALDWAIVNCTVGPPQHPWTGFAYRDVRLLADTHPAKGMWPEGTAQMICALRQAGRHADANRYLWELRRLHHSLLSEGKPGMVASVPPVLEAQPPERDRRFEYFRRQHVGATAWLCCADMTDANTPVWESVALNPYWMSTLSGGE